MVRVLATSAMTGEMLGSTAVSGQAHSARAVASVRRGVFFGYGSDRNIEAHKNPSQPCPEVRR
jgi:hypothetical protein